MSTGTELPAVTQGKPAVAARGAFERLHAFDGLFLRAEHLEVMQDYARDLALATGRAGGTGVVQGYGLTLQGPDPTVVAEPGLAVAPDGSPLVATEPLSVSLEGRDPGDSTYYRLLLRPGTWHHGEEPVQGLACDDPCTDGTTRHVLTAEGPWLSLEAVSDDRFGAHRTGRRWWLASHLFAQEEADVPRWPGQGGRDLPDRWAPWSLTTDPGRSVCLGVVFKESEAWQLDVWAVRRDRGGSPPTNRWQWGLGVRPWEVFVAQVVQFQAHLADLLRAHATGSVPPTLLARLGRLEQLLLVLADDERTTAMQQIAEIGQMTLQSTGSYDIPSLTALEIRDLPPAGFLPSTADSLEGAAFDVRRWLGDGLVRRTCTMSLGDLGGVLATAQSRPRTPLDEEGAAVLDIFVPVDSTGERATTWVLFVRADDVECHEVEVRVTEEVDVLVRSREGDAAEDPVYLGSLRYGEGTFSAPEDTTEVSGQLQALLDQNSVVTAVEAVTTTTDRQPLGLMRAALLATAVTGNDVPPLTVRTRPGGGPESIIIETTHDGDAPVERGSSTGGDAGDQPAPPPEQTPRAPARKPRRAPRRPSRSAKEDEAGAKQDDPAEDATP